MFSTLLFRYCFCSLSLIIAVYVTVKTCLCSLRAKSVFGFNFQYDKLPKKHFLFDVVLLPCISVIVGSEIYVYVLISLC
jgi:hypothetical protein